MSNLDFRKLAKAPPPEPEPRSALDAALSRDDFRDGLKVWRACGGPKMDAETLEIWYRSCWHIPAKYFHAAIIELTRAEEQPQWKNFVALVHGKANELRKREAEGQRAREWQRQHQGWCKQLDTMTAEARHEIRQLIDDLQERLR